MSRSYRRRHSGLRQPQITLLSSLMFVFAGFVMVITMWSLTPLSLAQPPQVSTRPVPSLWAQRPMESQTWVQPPLSTRGSEILDRTGRSLLLRGVNWFGLETESHSPHGLWTRNYKELITQIKDLGYNFIRLPYSVQMMKDEKVSGVDVALNPDLNDKKPIEVMDAIIEEAGRQGLMILLDSHRLNNQRIPELWYGDGYTEEDWITAWTDLATRYKDKANVIGADLKNEPHGTATWGTGDRKTDWRLAAERAGNAILNINPNWLIVVEGIENGMLPKQVLQRHWMGGNLEGVKRFPVRLDRSGRLVYSLHEYGPGVFDQPWFSEASFPNNLLDRWEKGFHFIARNRITPVLIGEFGGRKTDDTSKEGIWQNTLVRYIQDHHLHAAYWSFNPNSNDTGGILNDDWKTIDGEKQKMLDALLPAPRMRIEN
jgi:endoglucanase